MPSMPSENSASTAPATSSTTDRIARPRSEQARASASNAEKASAKPMIAARRRTRSAWARIGGGSGRERRQRTLARKRRLPLANVRPRGLRGRDQAPAAICAQRALEDFRRLAARDQVAVVDDHRRHRMDAELLPVALALAHLRRELVGRRGSRARARRRGRPRRPRAAGRRARPGSRRARGTRSAAHASARLRLPGEARPSAAGDARRRCSRRAAGRRTRSRPRRRARG